MCQVPEWGQLASHASCAALQVRLVWLKARRLSQAGAAGETLKKWLPQLGCWVPNSRRQLSHLAALVALILQYLDSNEEVGERVANDQRPIGKLFLRD